VKRPHILQRARRWLHACARITSRPAHGNGADKSYLIEDPAIGENFSEGEYFLGKSMDCLCPSE
jgi:hypothetical protein